MRINGRIVNKKNLVSFLQFRVEKAQLYWDSFLLKRRDRTSNIAIINCGANTGQSFELMKKYYPTTIFKHYLIEPNPECTKILIEHYSRNPNVEIIESALGTTNGTTLLYGSYNHETRTAVGASTLISHNFNTQMNQEGALTVSLMSLSELLKNLSSQFNFFVLKLDVEGSEYEILMDLIDTKSINLVRILYVEFHSKYYHKAKRRDLESKEKMIESKLSKKTKIRKWH